MEDLPAKRQSEPEVIDPEVVGYAPSSKGSVCWAEPKPSWWQRLKARVLVSLALGIAGLILCVVGIVFTLSIIGAAIGIPMILLGLFAIVMAIFLFLGGGNVKTISFHNFR